MTTPRERGCRWNLEGEIDDASAVLVVWVPFLFIALFAFSKIVNTWIRATHGYPLDDRRRRHGEDATADDVAGHVKHALKNRDTTIAKLEERVRVLERIVTDDSKRISAEIDALRT